MSVAELIRGCIRLGEGEEEAGEPGFHTCLVRGLDLDEGRERQLRPQPVLISVVRGSDGTTASKLDGLRTMPSSLMAAMSAASAEPFGHAVLSD